MGGLGAAGYGGWRYYSSLTTPGTLVVESTPPGAQSRSTASSVGRRRYAGTSVGQPRDRVTRRGITRRFRSLSVPGEQTNQTLDWSQVKETGSLAVSTDPVGAKVSVDGRPTASHRSPFRIFLQAGGGSSSKARAARSDARSRSSPIGPRPSSEAIFSGFLAVFAPVELQILSRAAG